MSYVDNGKWIKNYIQAPKPCNLARTQIIGQFVGYLSSLKLKSVGKNTWKCWNNSPEPGAIFLTDMWVLWSLTFAICFEYLEKKAVDENNSPKLLLT